MDHDVGRLEQSIRTATSCMNQVENVHTAIFVGNTRSGKSSLINYLIGNKLVGVKLDTYRPVSISKADDAPGPKIGAGYTSETIVPTKWPSPKLPGLTIWDVPGFDDNRGPIQDIVNSFYINGLFKKVLTAKIVVVIDMSDLINDNIKPLLNVLKSVESLLRQKMKDCIACVAMVLTKVPVVLYERKADKNVICEILQNQVLSSSEIDVSEAMRDLVQHMIRNNQNIGLFKRPEVGELTDTSVDDGIVQAIYSANSINQNTLTQISPTISESSKVYLFEVRDRLSFLQILINLQSTVNSVINGRMADFESMQQDGTSRDQLVSLNQQLTILKDNIMYCLNSPMDFESKIDSFKAIDATVENFIRQNNLIEMSKIIIFTDYALNTNEAQNAIDLMQNSFNNGLERINRLSSWIPLQFERIARREAEEQAARERVRQEEEMRQLQARIEEERRVQEQLQEEQRRAEENRRRKELIRHFEEQNRRRLEEQNRLSAEMERQRRQEVDRQIQECIRRRNEEAAKRVADMDRLLRKR